MSITAFSRSIDHFRKTSRLIYSCFLRQCVCSISPTLSSFSSSSSIPVLENPNLPPIRSAIPVTVGRSLYSTSAPTVFPQTSPSKYEDTKSSGGDQNSQQDEGKPVRGGPVSWLSFVLLMVTGAGIIFYYDREKKRHIEEINKTSDAVKEGPSAGKAAIGGPFDLINHYGKHVTEKDFMGKWTMLYFGFTHCPDICPDELQKLAAAVDKIKERAGLEVVPIFISVDPERDNVEQVREYVKEFHPKLIGLTGNPDEIKKAARAYRVYYMKTAEEASDYLVDHSIVMYLMGPDMDFVKFFGKNNDVETLADGVIKEIKQYRPKK